VVIGAGEEVAELDPLELDPLDVDPLDVDPLDVDPLAAASRFADAVALAVPRDSEREAVDATAPVFARAGSFPLAIRT
jgi:hypothetical protein